MVVVPARLVACGGVNNVCDRSKKIVGGRAKVRRLVPPSSQLPGSAPPSSNNAMALGVPIVCVAQPLSQSGGL
jgi:hypothetical protein